MPPRKSSARNIVGKPWFVLIELAGLGLSFYLFAISTQMFDWSLPCKRSKIIACTSIVKGQFSHFGPFSVAAMGLVYYVCQLALTAGLRDRLAQLLKAFAVLGGLVFIAWLRALELIYIKEICPWCWGVAALTLIHAGLTYSLVSPPMPRLRPAGLAGAVVGFFIVLIGLVSIAELGLGLGQMMAGQKNPKAVVVAEAEAEPEDVATPAKPSRSSGNTAKTPAAKTPAPKAAEKTPTPAPTVRPTAPSPSPVTAAAPTATPASTPSPTPSATPAPEPTFGPEPQIELTEEVRILKKRGWRHAADGAGVVQAIKAAPPVLLLAYDPYCNDCHNLITKILDNDVMNPLPVTRIAIQESMLSGQVDSWVKELPTMFVIDEDGSKLWEFSGSKISPQDLSSKIRQVIAK